MIEELGGSSVFLKRFSGKTFRINTGPCCCCCLCLPRVPMSRYLYLFIQIQSGCNCSGSNNSSLCSLLLLNRDLCHNLSSYLYHILYHIIIALYTLSILATHSLMTVYISNVNLFLDGIIQAIVILAEVGCSSVCNPKDGALCPCRNIVDKRQL